ncbi:response regulator [Noviherbaspirillum sp. CPCC 100848]|uniref:Response regulator n=1 Tax=Noviherbaspirillum album TaxID=3080276 RepID=A0ABU6JBL2_9BURK|nr:response regulator [Noviherbaspirillum sp. CPCC 100848]MEC4720642.1 response regulator [Noviherbaspirillum sp. CPCC 100848]
MASLRILVVEDNDSLLEILCEMLASLGYQTVAAASGEEALEHLRAGSFSVLLADINLPGMSGIDLATMAIEMTPAIKIIFSSGFGYLVSERLDFDFVLLNKPYYIHELAHAIRSSVKQMSEQ